MISTHKKYVIPASNPSINCTLHLLKPVSYRWMAVNDRPWRHQQLQQGARSILLHISQKQRGNSPASPDTNFTTRVFPTPARAWMLASPGGYQSRRGEGDSGGQTGRHGGCRCFQWERAVGRSAPSVSAVFLQPSRNNGSQGPAGELANTRFGKTAVSDAFSCLTSFCKTKFVRVQWWWIVSARRFRNNSLDVQPKPVPLLALLSWSHMVCFNKLCAHVQSNVQNRGNMSQLSWTKVEIFRN